MWAATIGLAAAAMLSASSSGELTFPAAEAPLPACPSSQPLRLILSDLELPRNRAVTIRAFAKAAGAVEPVYVGLLALMAESADARGNRKVPEARVTATPPFRQWLAAGGGSKEPVSVILRPYAGKIAVKELIWSVRSVRWVCRQ